LSGLNFKFGKREAIDTRVARTFEGLRKRACKTEMHTSGVTNAMKFQVEREQLNSWNKFWLLASRLFTEGHTASWAIQLTRRTRFRMLLSLPIPT
jgi:hypothetical protein